MCMHESWLDLTIDMCRNMMTAHDVGAPVLMHANMAHTTPHCYRDVVPRACAPDELMASQARMLDMRITSCSCSCSCPMCSPCLHVMSRSVLSLTDRPGQLNWTNDARESIAIASTTWQWQWQAQDTCNSHGQAIASRARAAPATQHGHPCPCAASCLRACSCSCPLSGVSFLVWRDVRDHMRDP